LCRVLQKWCARDCVTKKSLKPMETKREKEKQTILIVEDDEDTLDMLVQALSKKGYNAIKAENGAEAIGISSRNLPDLIILDLNLPDCNGIDILGEIKAMHKKVQVIILTGFGCQDAARSAMEMGAFDFLTKPFDINEIHTVIKEALLSEPPVVD